nr:MAG TPA: crystallin beta/gamma motif-containing protein [Caudoviricetes sp.]
MAKQTLEQERQEALAVQNGYVKTSPSFSASAGVQSKPTGGFTEVGNAIGAGIDTTAQVVDNAINAIKAIANTPRTIEETNADGTTTYYPFGKADNPYQGLEPLGQSLQKVLPTSVVSNTDRLFLYNNDTLRYNEAVRMGKVLDIDPDVIMRGDDKAFERADYLSRRVERGAVLQDIYDEFPELYKVKYGSQAEQLQAINNLQSIRATKSTFDAIQQGIWSMNDQMKLGDVGFELAHTKDPERINELTSEMERLQNNLRNYRTPDGTNPLQEVFGQTAAQAYMMGKQGGTGAIIGGAIGAVIGGLTTDGVGIGAGAATGAKWGGGADMAYEMYKMSFGNKYLELINKRDANGNKVYSNDEAYKYAMTYAAVDTGIEMASTRFMVKGIGKVAPKAVMSKVLQGATSDTIATFNRGIGTTVAQMAKASVKAGGSELVEEGLQDINEKFQHNLYRNANDPEGVYSIGDMAVGAGGAMLQALPAVIGLGAIGGGVSGIHTMKAFHEFQKLTPEEQQHAIMAEQNRNGNAIMQALKQDASSNKMAKENPELYGKIVQAQGDNVGVSTAYVNVNEMAETEQGQQAIKNMIDSGLVTQEEVSKSIEANADIPVPIGKYAQLSGGLTEETVKALEESTYFTRGGMSMKTLERAKAEVEAFNNNLVDATEKKAQRVKESIIRDEFEDASDVDREVLDRVFSNPTQVKQAYNNLYKNLVQDYRENYASDFDNMDNDIKEATASGVEPQWLTDYKSNNGGKAPRTNAERRRAAFHSSVAKAQTAFADNTEALNQSNIHHADMEHTLQQIESLERLHDKIFTLADNDIALRMQLSKSGYEVYNKVVKAIGESTDRKQRETAKANALLMAQHADVMAQYMRQMGKGGYTAMDYFRDSIQIKMNAVLDDQKGYNQNTKAVWESKLDKVLSDWANNVDNANNIGSKKTIDIMDSPLVFDLINLDLKRIKITGGVLHKILRAPVFDSNGKRILSGHSDTVSIDMLKQLPNTIANPSAIFSADNGQKIIIITEVIGLNGKPIMMPILLNKYNNRGDYHVVQSYYARNTNIAYYDLLLDGDLIYINKERLSNNPENQPPWLGGIKLSRSFINSIPNEKDLDNLRKKHNYQYYQSAWHGSPHDFDEFDLGAIGTGEGNQVHGWGLYFAKDKKVSKQYKDVLSKLQGSNKSSLFKVEIPNETELLPEQYPISGYGRYVRDSLKNGLHKMSDEQLERFTSLLIKYHKDSIIGDKWVNKYTHFMDVGYIISELHNKNKTINDINKIQKRNVDRFLKTVGIDEDIDTIASNDELLKNVYEKFRYELFPEYEKEKQLEREREEKVISNVKTDVYGALEKTNIVGKQLYSFLSHALGNDEHFNLHNVKNAKKASEFLNSIGIKGIYYDGEQDGRCYVVFDDKAIKVIEKYNQSVNGMTEIMSDGERIISIFKTADRSTFLHEMGHVFFDDIQKLASMDNAPKQLLDDWNALKEWSGWVDGDNVDNTKAHEKFARGWESYLRSGEAPTKGLQRVFRQFSKWLTRIYRSVQRLGGEVPSDIKDIMARMIATQDDIENYAHEQALEQFENTKLYQQLSETEQARVQGYIADIKEKAKERVMRKLMKELDNRPIKEWEDVKDDVQVEIEKRLADTYPTYKEHRKYDAVGDAALVNTQYGNIENLKKAEIEETGATFEDAIKQEMEHARSEFVEVNNIGKSNEQIAEEMLLSNQGQMALTEEEAKLIKQYTNKDLANNWQLLDKLQRLDPNRENLDAELAPIEKAITKAEQIKQDNAKATKELNSTSKELDKAEDKIEKLKAQLQERINAVRAIRDGGFGTIPKYMNKARAELGDLTLAQASQYKKYQNQAIRDGKNADRALAVNKVEEALEHKQSQMMNQARARVAFENQQRIKKLRTKLLEQNVRITRAKNPVMLDPQLRYFYTHMMYQMGLIKRDGLIPTDGFDETVITNRLDPDAGIAGFNTLISMDDTVSGIFNAKLPRTFATLTVNELNMLEELMTGMYKNGRREYEHNSFLTENGNPLSIDYVERDILDKAIETFGEVEESTFNIENSKTTKNAIFNKMANFVESLQQIKTILRRLDGGKGGPAEMYIYDTINRARQHFNERLESETMRLAKNVALYSRKELYKIRNERGYQVGDARNLTKEQVMALALNWGTERNRQRAIETVKANEVEIERLFQDVLDDRDWEFIIREWEQINSFYPERSAVQERMTGNPLKKEEGITFRIGGRTIEGQYYPIMYDPKTSGKSSNHEMEDIAQSFMSSNATFGYGMSATKSRLDKVKDKQLLLSLDVIPRAITESINHITMREAVTDVNTLINRKEFADYITNKLGASEYQYLRQWVRDQWTTEVSRLTEFDNMMQTIKRNISSAVMAGKVSVAIQNVANIPVAMEQLGAARVMRALYRAGVGVYGRGSGRYNETREFVLGKSVMLRERVQTLDKDMRRGLEIGGKGFTIDGKSVGGYTTEQLGEARDAINSLGYSLLSETDLMLSVPIWKDVYDVEYSKLVQKEGISLEWADQRAIELADKAIIDIFGSGDIKDQAGIQRNKGTIANFATTFYTYAGTLWNMQLDGFYAFKDRGDFKKFARVIFYDLFMQAVIMVIYNNLFGSDDDDDPTKVAKSLTKEFVNQSVMGVPFVREGITQAMNRMLGEKVYNRGTSPLSYAVIDKIDDIFTAVNSSKKDWTDVGRAGLQFANSMTGLSNTLTDGVMTIAKYGLTDIDAELEDLLYSVIFDKRLKSKKEKQKEKKQNKY